MRILFLGTHGQKNWGDELLLKTFIKQLSPGASEIYVNSYAPSETREYLKGFNVSVFDTQKDRAKLLFYMLRSDAIVFGGGSVLKELYTAYGGEKYATLAVIDKLTRVASMFGKTIYFCNIGVGPVLTDIGLEMTKRIVERAKMTTVRDSESLCILNDSHIKSAYKLTSDAVLSVSREDLGLSRTKSENTSSHTIGINLCRNIENNDNWEYFLHQLADDIVSWCKKNPNTHIVGIPMQFDVQNNNDAAELANLRELIQKKFARIKFTILEPQSVEELAHTIDGLDVLLAERLHTLILATIIGTPLVALEYDIKVTGVMRDLGLESYGLNINKQFEEGSILTLLEKVMSHKKEARSVLKKAYEKAHSESAGSFYELIAALNKNRT